MSLACSKLRVSNSLDTASCQVDKRIETRHVSIQTESNGLRMQKERPDGNDQMRGSVGACVLSLYRLSLL